MAELWEGDPRQVGVYRLEARLGGGGMGQVYLGRSPGGRPVAVKVVRPELAEDALFRGRFALEVEAARKVGGFYTAQLVDADVEADPPWLVTAYVPGPSLYEAVMAHGPLPPESLEVLAAGLAEGLVAIHAAGLVHRDLKPGNVILGEDGPRVIDFGIARAVDASHHTASVIGTPAFMSPEQGRGDAVGPASDVFSLGAVLAFAATGVSPFGTGPAHAIIYRIIHDQPDLTGLPDNLSGIITRCLTTDPEGRPALGDVLRHFAGAPHAHVRWLPPDVTTMIAERDATPENEDSADPPVTRTDVAPPRPALRGRVALAVGAALAVVTLGIVMAVVYTSSPAKGSAHVRSSPRPTTTPTLSPAIVLSQGGGVDVAAFSPDGMTLATASHDRRTIRLWDVPTGRARATLTAPGNVFSVAFDPGSTELATASKESDCCTKIELWSLFSEKMTDTLPHSGRLGAYITLPELRFSPDGSTLASATNDPSNDKDIYHDVIKLWNTPSGENTASFPLPGHILDMAFTPDGRTLASADNASGTPGTRVVRLWDISSGRANGVLRTGSDATCRAGARSLDFSPDGRTLAGGCDDNKGIRLWDVTTRQIITPAPDQGGNWIAYSTTGRSLISLFREVTFEHHKGTVHAWVTDPSAHYATHAVDLAAQPGGITTQALSPDGTTVAIGYDNGSIRLWKLR